jgi:hypothetical protein
MQRKRRTLKHSFEREWAVKKEKKEAFCGQEGKMEAQVGLRFCGWDHGAGKKDQ